MRVDVDLQHANMCIALMHMVWYVVCPAQQFDSLQWARAVSRVKLLDSNDPVFKWRKRLFDKYHECVYGTVGYDLEDE